MALHPKLPPKPPPGIWRLKKKRAERRRGRDLFLKILTAIGYLNTVIVISAAVLLAEAKPDAFHSMYRGLPLRTYWSPHHLQYLFGLCVFGFFLSLAGLFVNSQRLKRKSDGIRYHLVAVALLSLTGIIAYLVVH
ncbi:MAG: hypothetical protein JXX14_14595 [Deltaproteobacteria bacterium]|nr:hypothetical protein [Deltaproteobacteria bacterium]